MYTVSGSTGLDLFTQLKQIVGGYFLLKRKSKKGEKRGGVGEDGAPQTKELRRFLLKPEHCIRVTVEAAGFLKSISKVINLE